MIVDVYVAAGTFILMITPFELLCVLILYIMGYLVDFHVIIMPYCMGLLDLLYYKWGYIFLVGLYVPCRPTSEPTVD